MTYDSVTTAQVVAHCSFQSIPEKIIALPPNVSKLNNFMCGPFNRAGQLCGVCKKGYGPALLTNYECAACSTKNYGWALYLLQEFLPITVFYLVIVTFQVSATSGPLNVFIYSLHKSLHILCTITHHCPLHTVLNHGFRPCKRFCLHFMVSGTWNFFIL